jgi:hypothetical protein
MCERFGPCQFGIALVAEDDRLRWILRRWSLFGIPMPKWMMPNGDMHETVVNGKFVFHVEIRIPLVGHVVTYQGWLQKDIVSADRMADGVNRLTPIRKQHSCTH